MSDERHPGTTVSFNNDPEEVTLQYYNDEGERVTYRKDVAYGNIHLLLQLLDELEDADEPATVTVEWPQRSEDDEDAVEVMPASYEAMAAMKARIDAMASDGEIPLEDVEKWIKGEEK